MIFWRDSHVRLGIWIANLVPPMLVLLIRVLSLSRGFVVVYVCFSLRNIYGADVWRVAFICAAKTYIRFRSGCLCKVEKKNKPRRSVFGCLLNDHLKRLLPEIRSFYYKNSLLIGFVWIWGWWFCRHLRTFLLDVIAI